MLCRASTTKSCRKQLAKAPSSLELHFVESPFLRRLIKERDVGKQLCTESKPHPRSFMLSPLTARKLGMKCTKNGAASFIESNQLCLSCQDARNQGAWIGGFAANCCRWWSFQNIIIPSFPTMKWLRKCNSRVHRKRDIPKWSVPTHTSNVSKCVQYRFCSAASSSGEVRRALAQRKRGRGGC